MNRTILATALLTTLMLSACGGGGGGDNIKPEAPPPTPPSPPAEPPPTVCEDDAAKNNGGSLPCVYRTYEGVADNTYFPINADLAHEAGITGKGVTIGLLDDGHNHEIALVDATSRYGDYTDEPGAEEPEDNEKRGHGAAVGAIIAGRPEGDVLGGVAFDAMLDWGRICSADSCWSDAAGRATIEMTERGVRIFNLSIGSYYGDDVEGAKVSAAAWASGMAAAVGVDGLVVVSAGNDSMETSGFPAAAPIYEPQLLDNWLAVAALQVAAGTGETPSLSDYSNWCGDAAQWCLSAPGLHLVPDPESGGTARWQGTSMAAPVVTGVAALVQQAFPWMGGHNLQQTLLTTATDLGEAGVDSMYGWGRVDAEKAIRGPGQFVGDDFTAKVNGSSVFGNDISGEFGLIKNGTGSLRLDGNNTFLGDTVINAGTVGFKGDTASSVIVNDGGTYSARGGKIGADYIAAAGATTAITLGRPLEVGGAAILGGTLHLRPASDEYAVGGTENLLMAHDITGLFEDVSYANGFFWMAELSYGPTAVDAELTRASGAAVAMSSGASMAVVDGAGQMDALISELDQRVINGDAAGLDALLAGVGSIIGAADPVTAAALESLTGQIQSVQRTVGIQTAVNESRLLADRLPYLANTFAPTTWVQAHQVDGELHRDGYASANYGQSALTFGVDVPLDSAVIGAALTTGQHDANIAMSNSKLDADRIGVSGYAYKSFGAAYLSGVVGYEWTDVGTRRDVITGGSVEQVISKRDESAWHARIEAGITAPNGVIPFAAVGTIDHEQEDFIEDGAGGLGLSATDDTVSLTYADVGLRHQSYSGSWTFDSLLAYRNVFEADDTDFDAWFTGLPDAAIIVNGQALSENALRASLGAGYAFSGTVLLYGNVGVERTSGEGSNESASLGLRWSF